VTDALDGRAHTVWRRRYRPFGGVALDGDSLASSPRRQAREFGIRLALGAALDVLAVFRNAVTHEW
jgi:hypothetical protein